MTTRAEWEAMTDDEQLTDERIAIICEGEGCDEVTAREIMDGAQMGLFGKGE